MSEKKAKFTFVDTIIILVVLAVVVIGGMKFLPSMMNSSETTKTTFTIMVQQQDKGFADAITVGDNVTVSLTEKDGGVVKEVTTEPAKKLAYNGIEGTYSEQVVEGKYDVYVTVEADTEVSDLAIKTGGTAVKVGAETPVRGKGYAATGYVIEIDG